MSFILYLKVPPFPLFFMQIRLFEWGEACWRVSIGIPLKWKLERRSNGKWLSVEVWIISSWFVEAPFPSIGIQWFRQKNHEHDIKKKEQKRPAKKVSVTHSSNICPSEKLKLILSYLMSLSLMKRLIWAFVAFFTASLESWFYPGNEIKCIEQSPDWRTRAKLYNDEENSF